MTCDSSSSFAVGNSRAYTHWTCDAPLLFELICLWFRFSLRCGLLTPFFCLLGLLL